MRSVLSVHIRTRDANMMSVVCGCGEPIFIKKTGQCSRCYQREYARHRSRRAPLVYTADVPTTRPCSYEAAHSRVRHWRGRATEHRCADCGAGAEDWSYRGGSRWEQAGDRTYDVRGVRTTTPRVWSRHVMDYEPLCRACHHARDGYGFEFGNTIGLNARTHNGVRQW